MKNGFEATPDPAYGIQALDDLATGDHVVVILIRPDDPVMTHDVR